MLRTSQQRLFFYNLLAWIPYLIYVGFVVWINRGPIDYETFMEIGRRELSGVAVYGGNSYYPMPTVLIFAAFRALPRPISLALWLLLPVLIAWLISGRKPWVLLFGPLFGHFVGGQSAGLAMLGVWGWRRNQSPTSLSGGLWLVLLAFKPQLAVFPLLYAGWQWFQYLRTRKRIPVQGLAWMGAFLAWWLIGELALPGWVGQWLTSLRPISERALAGIIPRSLVLLGFQSTPILFWGLILSIGAVILVGVWLINRGRIPFDQWLLASSTFYPLIHDYDLIQFIPILENPRIQRWAIYSSIPLWGVIFFFYTNNHAWFAVTLIPVCLLCVSILQARASAPQVATAQS